jgi:hypothetical protein
MLYGRPPFHHITKPLPKMQAIIDAKVIIEFPSLKEKWEKSGHRYVNTHPTLTPSTPRPPLQHQRKGAGLLPRRYARHPAA